MLAFARERLGETTYEVECPIRGSHAGGHAVSRLRSDVMCPLSLQALAFSRFSVHVRGVEDEVADIKAVYLPICFAPRPPFQIPREKNTGIIEKIKSNISSNPKLNHHQQPCRFIPPSLRSFSRPLL